MVISPWDDATRGAEQAIIAAGKKPGTDVRIYSMGATKDGSNYSAGFGAVPLEGEGRR